MRVLILGYSKFVQNRVLPALSKLPDISVDIVSVSGSGNISSQADSVDRIFYNYDTALLESKADIVYVSTVNSTHALLVEKALRKGSHVIVDKPAFINFKDAVRLTNLADKSKLCLAESNIYEYHRQIDLIKDIFKQSNSAPIKLIAAFSFPPMNPDNFRYSKKLGGGALWDLGPYAVSIGRIFFNEQPQEIIARVGSITGKDNIDISFFVLARYSGGRSMIGEFGFDTEYRNYLNVLGPETSVSLSRIFTTPADMQNELQIQQQNKNSVVRVPNSDNFLNFFEKLTDAVKTGGYGEFSRILLADAFSLKKLRKSALGGFGCR